MQGQRSKLTTLPENIGFDHGSTSNDAAIDSWTSLQASAENRVPEYIISSSDTNSQNLHHGGLNGEWSLGESSSQNQADRKREHTWSIRSRAALNLEQHRESSNILTLGTMDVDRRGNQKENGSSILQISGPDAISQDLNMCSEYRDSEEGPNAHISSNEKMPHTGSSSDAFGVPDYRPGCSLDGQRVPCKRKALEVHIGQSSGAGSSSNVSMSTRAEHNLLFGGGPEPSNSGVRLGVGGAVSANPFSSSAETYRRNLRLRLNGSHHLDHRISGTPISTEANVGNSHVPSTRHSSRLVFRNHLGDLQPTAAVENGSHYSQPVLSHVRRNPQTRWNVGSSSRTSNSSASAISAEAEREMNMMLYQESISGNNPRGISEHPVFAPASEMGSSPQQPTNWNLAGGSNSSTSGLNSSSPWSHRSYPQYPRRLSEIIRRSVLSAVGTESGGQSSNDAIRSSSLGISQEMALSSVSGNHISNSREALLERHLDGALGTPHSLRSLAATSEGRSSIMSEIRHVLDIVRRGEGLRVEDMMILDHSVFFGMAEAIDRHRDMRMDVDNMSYEELLALEERIGDVCTGLNEETIIKLLKQYKYHSKNEGEEPCSICREEYSDGEDMGILDCCHDFHKDCIKQWLMHKNLCPICKKTGLTK
ncbi:hypothetical protein ACS0TY_023589 [Phlomoides rotata]